MLSHSSQTLDYPPHSHRKTSKPSFISVRGYPMHSSMRSSVNKAKATRLPTCRLWARLANIPDIVCYSSRPSIQDRNGAPCYILKRARLLYKMLILPTDAFRSVMRWHVHRCFRCDSVFRLPEAGGSLFHTSQMVCAHELGLENVPSSEYKTRRRYKKTIQRDLQRECQ